MKFVDFDGSIIYLLGPWGKLNLRQNGLILTIFLIFEEKFSVFTKLKTLVMNRPAAAVFIAPCPMEPCVGLCNKIVKKWIKI
jgi:hypothetical protein